MFKNPWDNSSENNKSDNANNKKQNFNDPFKEGQERIINFLKYKRGNKFNKKDNKSNFGLLYIVIIILILLWLSTGFFTVDTDEEGVIMRFGRYNKDAMPGLNYKLPIPFETVEKVSVTRIKKDVVGKIINSIGYSRVKYLNKDNNKHEETDLSYPKESQMLTGDENIIDMHFYVQWKIGNAKDYLFNIKDNQSDNIVRSAVESIMRQIIGEVTISEALSERRLVIEQKVKKGLQRVLDSYGSGIEVISVGILYSYVGPEVRDAYRDVQSAKADRERFINQAQAYSNEIIPKAKGEARAIIEGALAYKESEIAKATGSAQKFDKIYKAYLLNKGITKKRMYLDTMEKVYQDANKVIIDKEVSKGILPFLSLDKVNNK